MGPARASDMTFTIAGILVALFVLLAMGVLLERRPANLYLSVFLAGSLGSPLLFVGQQRVGLAMVAVALACVVPAYRLALTDGDGGADGGGGEDPPPRDPPPGGPDAWSEFERQFWSHVERTRDLVHRITGTPCRPGWTLRGSESARAPWAGAFVFRDPLAA
jgi:hypothetical protein